MTIYSFIKDQLAQFRVFNTNARKLILANLLFGLLQPFYLIFSNTFIFTSSHGNIALNLVYSTFVFVGILLGFVVNGYLTHYIHIKKLLALGAFLLFMSVFILFLLPAVYLTGAAVFCFGLLSGLGNGIYWSARNYLTLVNTNDGNRDFYAGLDFILNSAGRIITPLIIGLYIGEGVRLGWFTYEFAYRSTLLFALLLVVFIGFIVISRKFKTTHPNKFIYLKYSKLWNRNRLMTFFFGFFQGTLIALPPVLIMRFVGNEAIVGTISSVSYLTAIVVVYFISKRSGVQHRTSIFKGGSWLLFSSALFFAVALHFNSGIAVSVIIFTLFLCEPILGFPFRATFMKAVDDAQKLEQKDQYAYVFDVEAFAAFGRMVSIAIFYLLYLYIPLTIGLPVYMLFVAGIQFLNLRLSREINGY